ncbi:hypothetical protein BEN47_05290 [Hymenobacter lapidarius]|uniref:Outer membrane protein beta-barrel domain-containing protein n=1 Tax=Hymenobacter lapidarius TaxID=1908237 RepID=A0A1G1STT1_9BACT|nr:porin family protein [Hymenobacter lapidarius]OGX82032.1 hypothetical protein BEN47_05290 [Hymenobacter lapidarius]
MTRIATALTFLLLAAGSARAQLSVQSGANFATLSTQQNDGYRRATADGQPGYHLGLGFERRLTKRLALYSELQFSRQQVQLAVEDNSISDGYYDSRYRLGLSYLHLPVLLRANFGPTYVEAGPQASFLLAAHERGTESLSTLGGAYQVSFDRPATDRYRRFDAGLCVGAGVRLPAGFGLGLRASAGLVSLTHFSQPIGSFRGELKNRAVLVSLSYRFRSGS